MEKIAMATFILGTGFVVPGLIVGGRLRLAVLLVTTYIWMRACTPS